MHRLFRYRPEFTKAFSGYTRSDFGSDVGAGLTVGVVALPLAIGFAIASGAEPAQGLWTAIMAGIIIALFGGSRFQIGGPTGAFVPILAGVVALHGYEGLVLATLMAGVILVVMGLLRFGALLRYFPYPVVAGFTTGIAVIIFVGQLPAFLGLSFDRPGHLPELVWETAKHLSQCDLKVLVLGVICFLIVLLWPKRFSRIPGAMVAVVVGTSVAWWMNLPVATIASAFGEVPSGFPGFSLPEVSLQTLRDLSGPALTIAALGAIESLLSATVADGMTDTRHDPNSELVGQGLANIIVPLFGGFAATGAIARTAANIRSGARSPVGGIVHSLVLLGFVIVAAPLAGHIPLAVLSSVLMVVAIRMAEWDTFGELWRRSRPDFWVMVMTFLLTIVFDLTIGVGAGLAMAVLLFVRRMEKSSSVHLLTPQSDNEFDGSNSLNGKEVPDGVVLFRFEGPLFFAAAEKLEGALRSHGSRPKVVIFRMRHVPVIDATALHALEVAVDKMQRDGVEVILTAVQPQPLEVFRGSGLARRIGEDRLCRNLHEALELASGLIGSEAA